MAQLNGVKIPADLVKKVKKADKYIQNGDPSKDVMDDYEKDELIELVAKALKKENKA